MKVATFYISICCLITAWPAHAAWRAMTINTEWLWTPHDGRIEGEKFNRGDMHPAEYERELAFYALLIQQRRADIVALSEIENGQVARDLAHRLGPSWRAFFKPGRDTATGQDVALISRLEPIAGSASDFGFPAGRLTGQTQSKRLSKVLSVRFKSPNSGQTIGVVTSHFLSKRNDHPKKATNRLRQAVALNHIVSELKAQNDVVLALGDFNDIRGSKVLDALETVHRLKNSETACDNTRQKPARKSIDHILFTGIRCKEYGTDTLKSFSDHRAIWGQFE